MRNMISIIDYGTCEEIDWFVYLPCLVMLWQRWIKAREGGVQVREPDINNGELGQGH